MKTPASRLTVGLLLLAGFAAPAFAKEPVETPKSPDKAEKAGKPVKAAEVTTVEGAIELAKQENKMVFIQLGRAACGNCQALKKAIKSGQYRLPNKVLHVELNCDDPAVFREYLKRFKVEGGALPMVAITDGEGADLAHGGGFLSKAQFEDLLAKARKAAKKPAK